MSNSAATAGYSSIVAFKRWLAVAGCWTLIVAGLCAHALIQSRENVAENALIDARTNIDKDLAYRRWAAEKGGVYVPPSEDTPPNLYLNVPHRDVVTTGGVRLTLLNPAYMTRQVQESSAELYGIKGRLTSLKPLRPGNRPDSWEETALRELEKGAREVSTVVGINGIPNVRVMRAFVTEKSCLKCHASQGYAEGDIRGGISVSVPLEKYFVNHKAHRNGTLFRYGFVWILGLSGIWFLKRSLDKSSASLLESEARYRRLFQEQSVILEGSPAGICMLKDRIVQRSNSPFDALLGYERGGTIGKEMLEFYPDRDTHGRIGAEAYAAIAGGTPYCTEVRMRRKDGSLFWAEMNGHAVNRGNPDDGSIWIIRDISEHKQLERYREARQNALKLLCETSDCKEAIRRIVVMLKESLGFDAVGVRMKEGDDFPYFAEAGFPCDFLCKGNSLIARYADGGLRRDEHGNIHLECACGLVVTGKCVPDHPLFTPAGSFWTNDSFPLFNLPPDQDPRLNPRNECIRHQFASIALIPIRVGDTIWGLIHLNDRNPNRFTPQLMQELESMATYIGVKIAHDISDKAQTNLKEQLLQSQKMEAIGQLAGGVAHDFNNILSIIKGYCSLLQMDHKLEAEQREYIDEIMESSDKAAQLTRGLLAFSRKQALVMKYEDVNDVIRHVHKFLSRIIGEDISLNISCAGTELPVIADRGQLDQALINLATNARDAMPNGGVFSITSESVNLDASFADHHRYDVPPGKYALITVSDTGAGIRKEYLGHIFEPFFTTKEVGKGTGLGMSIVYGIIKQHNGFISVYSELDQGTTFRIYLPIREPNDGPLAGKIDTMQPKGGSETILVAEDDPAVRALVSKILTKYGYETILAEDGEDAVGKFKANQERIALVLMDVIMPKKNGREAFEEIQRIRPGTRALFSSGYTADFIVNRGVSEEGIELIMKPVQPLELLKKLRQLLDA